MARWLLGLALTLVVSAVGSAQQYPYPYAPAPSPGNYLLNYYNRQSQPLSPYLNLLRGGNPGVNYFYGVRPGTQPGNVPVGGGFGLTGVGSGLNRTNVLPTTLSPTSEPIPVDAAGVPIDRLLDTGHPVVFGPGPGRAAPGSGMNRPGFQRTPTPPTAARTPPKR
jgi:hypothetical protein